VTLKTLAVSALILVSLASFSMAGTVSYQYDDLGRLTLAEYPNGSVICFTYDSLGNRQSMTVISVPGSVGRGDINDDGTVDLTDAILALQVMCDVDPGDTIHEEADVNEDGKIGLVEALHILQKVPSLR
jgi:YD repeat-containing protein